MKIITNKKEACCFNCLRREVARFDAESGAVVCKHCGSRDLIDYQGQIFQPVFGAKRYYQASPYAKPMPDRRYRVLDSIGFERRHYLARIIDADQLQQTQIRNG
jgi:DNA-directed RNA polymerase subunit RPC12/RpoP